MSTHSCRPSWNLEYCLYLWRSSPGWLCCLQLCLDNQCQTFSSSMELNVWPTYGRHAFWLLQATSVVSHSSTMLLINHVDLISAHLRLTSLLPIWSKVEVRLVSLQEFNRAHLLKFKRSLQFYPELFTDIWYAYFDDTKVSLQKFPYIRTTFSAFVKRDYMIKFDWIIATQVLKDEFFIKRKKFLTSKMSSHETKTW